MSTKSFLWCCPTGESQGGIGKKKKYNPNYMCLSATTQIKIIAFQKCDGSWFLSLEFNYTLRQVITDR